MTYRAFKHHSGYR